MNFETYPFEKLNNLLHNITPNSNYEPLTLTIGEPQFETPDFIQKEFQKNSPLLNKYPKTAGEAILKDALIYFVKKRFDISLKSSQIIPTFGTREVLFNFPQFFLHDKSSPIIAFTNPFYQIYEGAAIASKAKIIHINLTKENNFKGDIDENDLKKCDLVIINFPNNPTSSTLSLDELCIWAKMAQKHNFVLINDECYSEIYTDKKPPSLLEAAKKIGNEKFKNILVLNSISKRSSAPGLRSGFIAGDEEILKSYMRYRTYVGCASPLPLQYAASVAWRDKDHVEIAREKYRENFKLAKEILDINIPDATFYIWLYVGNDLEFSKRLYKEKNLKVLPGSFLSRYHVGSSYVRVALVENKTKTKEALLRIKDIITKGYGN